MDNLLLEIGAEEIPAGYIKPALKALSATLLQKLTEARIEHGSARVYGTPRRLTVNVENVARKQKSIRSEVIGPPAKVGFDESGKPTMAAQKFAEKVGVPVNKLTIKETLIKRMTSDEGRNAIDFYDYKRQKTRNPKPTTRNPQRATRNAQPVTRY